MSPSTSTNAGSLNDTMRQYGRQARDYADRAQEYARVTQDHVRANPVQSAFLAFTAGLIYSKLFHKTRVHVVKMPVPVIPREVGASLQAGGQSARRLLHDLGDSSRHAARNLGQLGAAGLMSARAAGADAWDHARATVPHQVHWAGSNLRTWSQAAGDAAQVHIREHPLAGVGLALGAGALLAAALTSGSTHAGTRSGLAVQRPRAAVEGPFRAEGTIGAHPVTAAALALLAGALLGALVRR
jgi:ElaB/YqjD/DUF883 family membrane-anchored ribosome-binding protein